MLARLKEIGTDEAEQLLRNYGAEKEAGATAKKAGGIDKAKFEKIKSDFGIKNINDYINVQRNVFETLKNEGFFSDEGGRSRTVTNKESGLQIEINKSSIDETFSSGNKFEYLSKELKYLKLATIKEIADLIENAHLLTDDNENYHSGKSGVTYAYLETETTVDGKPVTVVMDIRKSPQKKQALGAPGVYKK